MKIRFTTESVRKIQPETLILVLSSKDSIASLISDKKIQQCLKKAMKRHSFKPEKDKSLTLSLAQDRHPQEFVLIGMGSPEECNLEAIRKCGATTLQALEHAKSGYVLFSKTVQDCCGLPETFFQAFMEGLLLSAYKFTRFKKKATDKEPTCTLYLHAHNTPALKQAKAGYRKASLFTEAALKAKELCLLPANKLTPRIFAKEAKTLAKKYGLRVTVFNRKMIEKNKMAGILAVSSGSVEEPRFVILEKKARAKKADTYVLVGKGITFDSGGISIKPSARMHEMKCDMAGAAAVLGTMLGVAQSNLPVNVVGLMPLAENLPSGSATKPGDIAKMMNGTFVEILNTDAEGRLVLADALHYAGKYKPKAIIDLATLTGAIVSALGHNATGIMGNNQKLIEHLIQAGESSGERLWQLPLWPIYHEQIKSDLADIKNISSDGAGPITAACFLENFLPKDTPWAHLDIAGTAWLNTAKGYLAKGPTGVGVRLLLNFLSNPDLRRW